MPSRPRRRPPGPGPAPACAQTNLNCQWIQLLHMLQFIDGSLVQTGMLSSSQLELSSESVTVTTVWLFDHDFM